MNCWPKPEDLSQEIKKCCVLCTHPEEMANLINAGKHPYQDQRTGEDKRKEREWEREWNLCKKAIKEKYGTTNWELILSLKEGERWVGDAFNGSAQKKDPPLI